MAKNKIKIYNKIKKRVFLLNTLIYQIKKKIKIYIYIYIYI